MQLARGKQRHSDTHHTASELLQGGASALLCFRLHSQRKKHKNVKFNISVAKANMFACISYLNKFVHRTYFSKIVYASLCKNHECCAAFRVVLLFTAPPTLTCSPALILVLNTTYKLYYCKFIHFNIQKCIHKMMLNRHTCTLTFFLAISRSWYTLERRKRV